MYKNLYKLNLEYLIKLRSHIGHKDKNLNKYLNPYLYGTRHNINIFNINKLWISFKYLFYNFSEMFLNRNSFFIVGTNKNLPMDKLLNNWLEKYPLSYDKFNSFYISGYIDKKWIEGVFTNWKIFYAFIDYINVFDIEKKRKYKYEKYFCYLKGIVNLKKMPIPDFIIMLDKNEEALHEIKNLQIPLIGIIDTDINPNDFIYKFFGNNDSIENLEFFFEFLNEAAIEGRLKEQQLFFFYLIKKIKKKLKKRLKKKIYGKKNKNKI